MAALGLEDEAVPSGVRPAATPKMLPDKGLGRGCAPSPQRAACCVSSYLAWQPSRRGAAAVRRRAAGDPATAEWNDGTVAAGLSDSRRRRGMPLVSSLSSLLPSHRTLAATQAAPAGSWRARLRLRSARTGTV